MIDTHAHLNFKEFDKDLDNVISRSFDEGLDSILVASSSIETSKKALDILKKDKKLYASVGIHPHDIGETDNFSAIEKMADSDRTVAIGECGLDYFRLSSCHSREGGNLSLSDIKDKQKTLFEKHIKLAEKTNLPLIFHNRDSDNDFYDIIKNYKGRAVLHCYTGDWDFAKKILDLGFLISFTGIVTFDKTGKLEEVIKKVPLDRFMVETDAPFLAPAPHRGKRAEPWMVKEVVEKIAEIKNLSFEEVDKKTTTTAKKFFGI
jgi:TatD DNase family protein